MVYNELYGNLQEYFPEKKKKKLNEDNDVGFFFFSSLLLAYNNVGFSFTLVIVGMPKFCYIFTLFYSFGAFGRAYYPVPK